MLDPLIEASLQSPLFFYSLIFIVSLMVGSFLNVVIYRLPIMMENSWKQEYQAYFSQDNNTAPAASEKFNLAYPQSTCPKCNHKIKPWENIPVISYLFLRGKCANCKTPISLRYPAVELATAIIATFSAWQFDVTVQALWIVLVCYILISLTFIDLDKMLLPDHLTLPLLWLGLLLSTQHVFVSPTDAIIGASAGYLSLWSVYWLFKILTGKEGMGFGDFKLLGALGAFTGWQGLPIIIVLSSFVGAIVGIILLQIQRRQSPNTDLSNHAIPFGPYLAVAGWITLLYKDAIIEQYIAWIMA